MNPFRQPVSGYASYQTTVLTLGIGHGFSDAAAGYMIGYATQHADFLQTGSMVLLYNLLAFGGQLPAGMWLDRVGYYRRAAVLSLFGMMVALGLLPTPFIWIGIFVAGISSAIFHVAGGATTLASFPGKARFVGLFSAFGVLGLALGGWAGALQWQWVAYPLALGLGIIVVVLQKTPFPPARKGDILTEKPQLDRHDYMMILLLLAIALRSAIWNIIQLLHTHHYDWLFYMALAAVVGKLLGGWLTDRIPWKTYTFIALAIIIPALGWGYRKLFWLLLGTALLQSLTPVSVVALQCVFPTKPATVSGAAFGLAIALGGITCYLPVDSSVFLILQLVLFGLLAGCLYISFSILDRHRSLDD